MLQGDIRQFAMRGIFEPSCQAYAIVKVTSFWFANFACASIDAAKKCLC